MATLKEMIDIAGSIEKAEKMARTMMNKKDHLLDLILLLSAQGKAKEAERYCRKMLEKDPRNVRALYNLGWYYLLKGDMVSGFKYMNEGRRLNCFGNQAIGSDKPVWNGEPLDGKTLLFSCEAGYGDIIIFIRFVRTLNELGAKVVVSCCPEMMSLISRVEGVSSVVQSEAALAVYHDYWLPAMYAPVSLKTQFEDLSGKAYITPDQRYVEKFKQVMRGDRLKIGIRWLGREGEDYIPRVFPETLLFEAVSSIGADVYSLQKDIEDKGNYPARLIDMDHHMASWEDTAGIIANLDLVISSCTGVAHLAAAMGKPTLIVVPVMSYFTWTYPRFRKSCWYDSVRLYRQRKWGEWKRPFENIRLTLNKMRG